MKWKRNMMTWKTKPRKSIKRRKINIKKSMMMHGRSSLKQRGSSKLLEVFYFYNTFLNDVLTCKYWWKKIVYFFMIRLALVGTSAFNLLFFCLIYHLYFKNDNYNMNNCFNKINLRVLNCNINLLPTHLPLNMLLLSENLYYKEIIYIPWLNKCKWTIWMI